MDLTSVKRIIEHGAGMWKKSFLVVQAWRRKAAASVRKTKPSLTFLPCRTNTVSWGWVVANLVLTWRPIMTGLEKIEKPSISEGGTGSHPGPRTLKISYSGRGKGWDQWENPIAKTQRHSVFLKLRLNQYNREPLVQASKHCVWSNNSLLLEEEIVMGIEKAKN